MANLLTNNQMLRQFLGAAYSASDDINRIAPYLDLAETTYIEKAIGSELLAHLKTVADNENSAGAVDKNMLTLVRRAQAFYGYWLYLPYSTGVDGDNGLQESKTERTQPIRQAMLEKRLAATADNASKALEGVLLLLFAKPSDFPTWEGSDTYKSACELFVRSATELKKACPYTRGHHRLYLSLREYLQERQRKSIVPLLGEDFANGLLERMRDDTLSDDEKRLMPYIQRALAYSAYADALLFLVVVQLPNEGLRILSEFDGINNQRALSDQDEVFCKYHGKITSEGEAYQRELKRYLDANSESFPNYTPTPEGQKPQRWPIDNSKYNTVIRMR